MQSVATSRVLGKNLISCRIVYRTSCSAFRSISVSRKCTNTTRPFTSTAVKRHGVRPAANVFYHKIPGRDTPLSQSQSGSVLAVSFIDPTTDAISGNLERATSPLVVGWVPVGEEGLETKQFVANDRFTGFLQDTIRDVLENELDEYWTFGAMQLQNGWMHIHDQRNIPALGRIGDPDDIIGSVLVEDSKIKPETYQPMPSYRVYTRNGITQLPEATLKRLKERLVELNV